jgi:hypothetical protein
MNRRSTATSDEQRPRPRHRRSYDQAMTVEIALFAITVMTSILTLTYYIHINLVGYRQ